MEDSATPVASPASETATAPSSGAVSADSRSATLGSANDVSTSTPNQAPPSDTVETPTNLRDALRTAVAAGGPAARRGPIPYDRHEAILKKQRDDAAAEHTAFVAKYAGLETISPEQWGDLRGLMVALAQNPLDAIGRMLDELGQNPATARQLQGWIAQRFPAGPPAAAAVTRPATDDDPMPAPDGDGGYTQAGLIKLLQWQTRRTMAEMTQANAPLRDEVTRMRADRQQAEAIAQANTYASNLLTEVHALPGFKEHQAAIKAKFLGMRFPRGVPNEAITAALYRCYLDVVMPTFQNSAKQAVMDSLDHKAKANTTPPQGRATSAAPAAKPLKLREALAAEFASDR